MMRYLVRLIPIVAILGLILPGLRPTIQAQSPDGQWSDFVNISQTTTSSTYPCIAADTAGNVHVLWSEDVGGIAHKFQKNPDGTPKLSLRGSPIDLMDVWGNTLYYTRWDGEKWLAPIDVQFAEQGNIQFPAAVVDSSGILHVVWMGSTFERSKLYYSHVPANKAESANEWSEPIVLAEDTGMNYYNVDIATDLTGGLHILYAQLGTESGAYVLNSFDGGKTWSDSLALYRTFGKSGDVEEGVSAMKLVTDKKGRLHATWTRYDQSGNGKAVYYIQSRDAGRTWTRPLEVAAWKPGWYETDWLNVGVIGDEIHLVWEGGEQARLNERVSYDGGLTWSESRRILSNLVGENGFAELAVDSANHLHMLNVNRGVTASLIHGLWYTRWKDNQWEDSILLGSNRPDFYELVSKDIDEQTQIDLARSVPFFSEGVRYPRAAIVNGNQLFVVIVNEFGGDIWSSHTTVSAPFIPPHPYAPPGATPTLPPTSSFQALSTPTPLPRYPLDKTLATANSGAGNAILIGILPVLLFIAAVVVYARIIKRP